MRIPLNRFIGMFPLYFDFQIVNDSFKGYIPIPENYPKTPITERHKKFGHIDISISEKDLFIEYFGLTINEGGNRLLATEEEKTAFKGIGKQMLCLSLQLILFKFDTLSNDTIISLESNGGRCTTQYIPDNYKTKDVYNLMKEAMSVNPYAAHIILKKLKSDKFKIASVGNNKKLLFLYKTYPSLFNEDVVRIQACSIIENNRLIEYYKNLGFRLEGYYKGVVMASMSCKVGEMLCF